MRFTLAVTATALTFITMCTAHYRWTQLVVNGSATADYQYVRQNTNYNSPVTDVSSNDIRCNTETQANAGKTQTATVAAGTVVGLRLDQPIYHPVCLRDVSSRCGRRLTSLGGGCPVHDQSHLSPDGGRLNPMVQSRRDPSDLLIGGNQFSHRQPSAVHLYHPEDPS